MSRGMKKWLPFASLKEQAEHLRAMQLEKQKVERPLISEDTKAHINEILTNYNGEQLTIIYFSNGFIKELQSIIKKIDVFNKVLVLEEKRIHFRDILNIEQI